MVDQYLTGWAPGTSLNVVATQPVPAGHTAYLGILFDTPAGGSVSTVSGLGATWTDQPTGKPYFKVYKGVGASGTGAVTVAYGSSVNTVLALWFVPNSVGSELATEAVSVVTGSTVPGPEQLAGPGQVVLNMVLTYANIGAYPSPSPASYPAAANWTAATAGAYAGAANRSPIVTEAHRVYANMGAGGSHSAMAQIVVGTPAALPTKRFYLPNTSAATIPGPALASSWLADRYGTPPLVKPAVYAGLAGDGVQNKTVTSAYPDPGTGRYIMAQHVGPNDLSAGEIKGWVRAAVHGNTQAGGSKVILVVRVVSSDLSTIRGTLFDGMSSSGMNGTLGSVSFTGTLTPVVAQAGDRIVIETGSKIDLGNYASTYRYGSDVAAGALPYDPIVGDTAKVPWVDLISPAAPVGPKLKLGSLAADKVYLGSNQIQKMYLGSSPVN